MTRRILTLGLLAGTAARATAQWTVTVLGPGAAGGIHAGQQAGSAPVGAEAHACVWSGAPNSWVDLNPAGSTASQAYGVGDGQQVGIARIGGVDRASLW